MRIIKPFRCDRLLAPMLVVIGIATVGCQRQSAPLATAPARVLVSHPVEEMITDYSDLTGVTSAVDSVEIRARVYGYLDKVNFKEGSIVHKGDVLYEIDARTYQAIVNQAQAKVNTDEAQARFALADFNRLMSLRGTEAVTKSELDKALAAKDVAASTVAADRADLAAKQLDLGFTKVLAPVDGRTSRTLVTVGNLVQSSQNGGTLLTTIVSVNPMYCTFDVDERTLLQVQKLIREGKVKSARDTPRPVFLGLANQEGYPLRGTINLVDNQVNPKTGTLRLRGVFPNPDGILMPGLFAHIRVPIGEPHKAILVSDRAIDTDQGQKILYLVDDKNTVFTRPVRLGAMHNGLRAIEDGAVNVNERVIVEGLQQVKSDAVVEPKLVPMPIGSVVADTSAIIKTQTP